MESASSGDVRDTHFRLDGAAGGSIQPEAALAEGNHMAKPATKPKVESSPATPTASTKPPGAGDNSVTADQLKSFYRDMLLIRRFEERAGQLYGMGLIGGFCHLYIGQEAVVVGMQSTIKLGDSIITSYRDHGHMLAAGMDPKGVMAELTGR